jgi:hypothetical protein
MKWFYRVGSPAELANAFVQWQTFISTPAVLNDRAFNSVISVTGSTVLVQGTRFGTQAELEASAAYIYLNQFNMTITELDWLASIVSWASNGVETFLGSIVGLPFSISTTAKPNCRHSPFLFMSRISS